jgi:hypothetical protein
VLIDRYRGLRAGVAVLALEVKSSDAIFALYALERDAALDRFGCVASRSDLTDLYGMPRKPTCTHHFGDKRRLHTEDYTPKT